MRESDIGDVTIEGFITVFESPLDFHISDVPVRTTPDTRFEGDDEQHLRAETRARVSGTIEDGTETLVATSVDVEPVSRIQIGARVDDIDVDRGAFTLLGLRIQANELTRFEDNSDTGTREFGIDDIRYYDYLEVTSEQSPPGSGPLVATSVERVNGQTQVRLSGFVDTQYQPRTQFNVHGIWILTSSLTKFERLQFRRDQGLGDRQQLHHCF